MKKMFTMLMALSVVMRMMAMDFLVDQAPEMLNHRSIGSVQSGDTTYIYDLYFGDAYYHTIQDNHYWTVDLHGMDFYTYDYDYPELYFTMTANSKTAIAGECELYYAGLWTSAKDSVEFAEGEMTISYDKATDSYFFDGVFTEKGGKVYVISTYLGVALAAYDADNGNDEIKLKEGGAVNVDTITVNVNYVAAMRKDSYSSTGSHVWYLNAMNYTDATHFDVMWFYIKTAQNNRLEGEYNIDNDAILNFYGTYSAGYSKIKGKDTTAVKAGDENIELRIVYNDESKKYDLQGEMLSDDGTKLYQFEVEDFKIVTYDEQKKTIVLVDSIPFVPDTIAIKNQDAISITYYASDSKVGSYNYSVDLSNATNYYPYLMLDIYTNSKDVLTGTYNATNGNVGNYCSYAFNKSTKMGVSNVDFTITDNDSSYTVKGRFTGSDKNIYTFDVSAMPKLSDGDYPFEPYEKQPDITIDVNNHKLDNSLVKSLNQMGIELYSSTDTIILSLNTDTTGLADGVYIFSENPNLGELSAGYYSSLGVMGSVAFVIDKFYYLVSGTLTVSTTGNQTTLKLEAASAHDTKISITYVYTCASGLQTTTIREHQDKFIYNGNMLIRKYGTLYNAQGQVVNK